MISQSNGELISRGYNEFVAEQAQLFLPIAFWAIAIVATCVVVLAVRRMVRR